MRKINPALPKLVEPKSRRERVAKASFLMFLFCCFTQLGHSDNVSSHLDPQSLMESAGMVRSGSANLEPLNACNVVCFSGECATESILFLT